ncbi:geranylgeranyl reductase family protein [Corynebacterium aquatimens]|uniref:Geranylgeranyl reductase family protein n=1 Tax=Corynebacterium aquatimens TaxID=1190508 RepID=A0A931GWC7_9CORY|nr:geranylgeranyl reductase family protein [Corynebacterium aquatimens]MBG6122416.1 geranylgeranyl reductase family protein [Corynebacterium aquatimens]WJY65044.1 Putative oxidoreductase [Corynebacterium aquatimens]
MLTPSCLVIGAGPAGSAAAIALARAGLSTLLIDGSPRNRDKTCGDGLTPRAVHSLRRLGLSSALPDYRNKGLKLHGFGGSVTAPWPAGMYGDEGSARPRVGFDAALADMAAAAGARVEFSCPATSVERGTGGAISVVHTPQGEIRPRWVIVADGVRSGVGKQLGRTWHRGEVFGIAARSYCATPFSQEPWMHSHVELRSADGEIQPGYGWIFPLGDGTVNLGCGALSTDARPAKVNTKKLLHSYASQVSAEWQLGPAQSVTSALLPMGGAVSGVAGPNWMLIGDAAACVNPLNGEGIDYGLETAILAASLITGRDPLSPTPASPTPASPTPADRDFTLLWPHVLREHYGEAFVLARTLARLLTYPQFLPAVGPLALRGLGGKFIMPAAARLMGNLVTEEDKDLVARLWRLAGSGAYAARAGTPLWDP